MTDTVKIPLEDLAEADRLEVKARWTDDPVEARALRFCADLLRTPPSFVVHDHPRTDRDEEHGREVLEEFGAIAPYTPEDDRCKTLPLRLVHDAAGGVQMEFGPYNLDRRDIRVLHRAIRVWAATIAGSRERQAD